MARYQVVRRLCYSFVLAVNDPLSDRVFFGAYDLKADRRPSWTVRKNDFMCLIYVPKRAYL